MPTVVSTPTAEELAQKQQEENDKRRQELRDASTEEDVKFFNQQDGLGRPRGVYLDVVERQQQEVVRAKFEGREADNENPPVSAGTPLVVKSLVADNRHQYGAVETEPVETETLPVSVITPDPEAQPKVDTATMFTGTLKSPETKTGRITTATDALSSEVVPTAEEPVKPKSHLKDADKKESDTTSQADKK